MSTMNSARATAVAIADVISSLHLGNSSWKCTNPKGNPFKLQLLSGITTVKSARETTIGMSIWQRIFIRCVEDVIEVPMKSQGVAFRQQWIEQESICPHQGLEELFSERRGNPYVSVDGSYLHCNWAGEFQNVAVLLAIVMNEDYYCEGLGAALRA